jgi:hypothetical protein
VALGSIYIANTVTAAQIRAGRRRTMKQPDLDKRHRDKDGEIIRKTRRRRPTLSTNC